MTSRTLAGSISLTGAWALHESGWKTAMDENLLRASVFAQLVVISRTTAAPPGSPANGDIYIVPASGTSGVWVGKEKQIAVRDNGAWVYYTASEGWVAWVKDEDILSSFNATIWTTPTVTMYMDAFSVAAPTSSQILLDRVFADAALLPDNFAGSVARVGTNPTSTFVIDVKKNGSNVGTISISTSGVATFNTTGTTVSFVSGDYLTLVAPSSTDATIARLSITLKGTRNS